MRLEMRQVEKTSLEARFDISTGGQTIGLAVFSSFIESGQGIWSGSLGDCAFELRYAKARLAAVGIDEERPYDISVDGQMCGSVGRQADVAAAGVKVLAVNMDVAGRSYVEYPFSRGRKGYRYPIFENGRQIAEVSKECKVRDDLHVFEIAVEEDADVLAAVLLCCYTFSQSWWYPGPPRKHHSHLYIQRATQPGCTGYDAGFFDRIAR